MNIMGNLQYGLCSYILAFVSFIEWGHFTENQTVV